MKVYGNLELTLTPSTITRVTEIVLSTVRLIPARRATQEIRQSVNLVLQNVVDHAYKKQDGVGPIRIRVIEDDRKNLMIVIKDDGCGFDAYKLKDLDSLSPKENGMPKTGFLQIQLLTKFYFVSSFEGRGAEVTLYYN